MTKRLYSGNLEKARKASAKKSAIIKNGYTCTMDELNDKCSALLKAAKSGSKAKAVRAYFYTCMGGYYPSMVRECGIKSCFLWRYRMGKGNEDPGEIDLPRGHFYWDIASSFPGRMKRSGRSRLQSIRLNCHMCRATTGNALIESCEMYDCPLWRYRMGRGNEDPKEVQEVNQFLEELDEEDDFQY